MVLDAQITSRGQDARKAVPADTNPRVKVSEKICLVRRRRSWSVRDGDDMIRNWRLASRSFLAIERARNSALISWEASVVLAKSRRVWPSLAALRSVA